MTGQSCEYYLVGRYPIENGSLTGGALAFDYTFSVDRVDAALTLSADGQTPAGTYTSTKCTCDPPGHAASTAVAARSAHRWGLK